MSDDSIEPFKISATESTLGAAGATTCDMTRCSLCGGNLDKYVVNDGRPFWTSHQPYQCIAGLRKRIEALELMDSRGREWSLGT